MEAHEREHQQTLGTDTGRFSSRDPNLQNLPRGDRTHTSRADSDFFEHCSGLAAWHRTARDRAKETTEGRTATPPAINRAPTGSDLDFD